MDMNCFSILSRSNDFFLQDPKRVDEVVGEIRRLLPGR